MLAILQLDGLGVAERRRLAERGAADLSRATAAVAPVLEAIRTEGDAAIARFLRDVDGVELDPARFRLTADEIAAARAGLQPELAAAFARTIRNLEVFHRRQLAADWEQEVEPGVVIGERILAVAAAGVYVPFGKAVYPSSALMLTVPARIAGVERIVLASGADPATGEIPGSVVAAASMGGATEIWRVSGTAAVGAWAFGTATLAPVDVVAGPGGPYVAAAKRLVQDRVGVDLDAGPSETLVLALDDANPRLVAIDVLSEAEHGPDSHAYAVCADPALAVAVAAALGELAASLPDERRAYLAEQRDQGRSAIIVAADRQAAIRFADELAVEHVVVHAADPEAVAAAATARRHGLHRALDAVARGLLRGRHEPRAPDGGRGAPRERPRRRRVHAAPVLRAHQPGGVARAAADARRLRGARGAAGAPHGGGAALPANVRRRPRTAPVPPPDGGLSWSGPCRRWSSTACRSTWSASSRSCC